MNLQPVPDTRARILTEAERLFAADGFDGVSMREIAEAAAVTKANIYYYFKDKQSLYLEIIQSDMVALVAALDESASANGTCRDRIARLAGTFWELMHSKAGLIQLTLRQFGGLERGLRGLIVLHQHDLVRPIVDVLDDGVRAGELRPMDTRLAAVCFLGMLSVFVAGRLLDIPIDGTRQDTMSQTVSLFFDGVAACPGEPAAA